ncbi:sulfotransferase 1A3-like [Dreissena polymorpha]|uniref:Sulfotransferase domain-containing protein n=1 Tax=Dreissena polymorpha TaxID=45954 RepID=A0A9D4I7N2_DREPO|nr:sulfotransferase 1A3-like [Dreissena polymorpha]KAH3752951.1 hypothetical protein DPMN_187577 [Dreissena polymorpha]
MENSSESEKTEVIRRTYSHKLPGEHLYDDILFFGYTPADVLDAVKDFEVRDDDVFIATYPKAGTTWLQELTWLIMHDGNFEEAYQKPVYFRSPFLEFKDEVLNEIGLDIAAQLQPPRIIKSHLPVTLMPNQIQNRNCKTLVLFRNPKDVCVSYYHFYRASSSFGNFRGSWEEFMYMFLDGYVDHGSWFEYTKGWWGRREDPNTMLVFYEDLKRNLRMEVDKLCAFLGKPLPVPVREEIARHCRFENMKQNPMTNHMDVYSIDSNISPLLRKGEVGDWKTIFTVAQSEQFDKFCTDELGHLDIPFRYTLH